MSKDTKKGALGIPTALGLASPAVVRPLKVVRDKYGRLWLCHRDVNEEGDLEAQGCWRCGDLTFTNIG